MYNTELGAKPKKANAAHVLRLQVRDEHRHQGQELLHRELIPEGVDELNAVRPHDGPGIYVGILGSKERGCGGRAFGNTS